jgi:hypothetical protein
MYAFVARKSGGKTLYESLTPTAVAAGSIDLDVPESSQEDWLLLVGRVSGRKAVLPPSLDNIFYVGPRKQ